MYTSQKNITRFHNLGYSYFLDPKELKEICSKFKKNEYMIYHPYPDSEKNMIYHKTVPEVSLYEIHTSLPLRHQDILGALYSLNIAPDLFGDIVITEDHYYLFLLPIVQNYVEVQLTKIRDVNVELEKVDLSLLEDYHRNYETIELIVSSCRIDTILSSILHTARSNIIDSIKKKEILFNYEILTKLDLKVKEGDIFSIRKVGKFRFEKVIKRTKQDHYIIEVSKYV
jgi:RNA-binding protein YlmH